MALSNFMNSLVYIILAGSNNIDIEHLSNKVINTLYYNLFVYRKFKNNAAFYILIHYRSAILKKRLCKNI
jgi:hypothetical protein